MVEVGHQQFPFYGGAFQILGVGDKGALGVFLWVCISKEKKVATFRHILAEDVVFIIHGPEPFVVAVVNHRNLSFRESKLANDVFLLKL